MSECVAVCCSDDAASDEMLVDCVAGDGVAVCALVCAAVCCSDDVAVHGVCCSLCCSLCCSILL